MGFKLSAEAREFFKKLDKDKGTSPTGNFEVLWDPYYVCLMVGLIHRKAVPKEPPVGDFLDTFPSTYYSQRHELLAALVSAELDRKGITRTEEPQVRHEMLKLLTPETQTNLTADGFERMNSYAQAGYEILRDKMPPPSDMSDFLVELHHLSLEQDARLAPPSTGVVRGRRGV